ncbi:hypothetical protein R6Q57_010428 [Mikania cordata]
MKKNLGSATGNEPFLNDYKDKYINSTLLALQNIQKALDDAKLGDKIKASVPFNGDIFMSPQWRPIPSAGLFRPDVSDEVEDIADFLAKNNAPFIVNIHPFLSLAMGDALKQIGHENMTIVVGEIGWPLMETSGPTALLLQDEDSKSMLSGGFERHWGVFDYAGQPKFKTNLARNENKTLVGAKNVKYKSKRWCILKTNEFHDKQKQNESMIYACDRADCSALVDGGSCNVLSDCEKASYAFNSFFQMSNQSNASCDFGRLAT